MPDTFESDDDDFDLDDETEHEPVIEHRRSPGRPARDSVPDSPVENAADIPLLVHAGSGKTNTVTYLKITRLDGPRGVRGLKGQMPPESTYESVARKFGNGTYKIEGCNYRHKVLAREEGLEIAIPGFDDDPNTGKPPLPPQTMAMSPNFSLHGMKMIQEMSARHGDVVTSQSSASNEQVREMASKTMEMLTAFTAAQRESERNSYQQAQANQQAFFASMMAMQQTAHQQQMQLLTAMQERERTSQVDPMQMIQVFMDGLKAGGEMGGDGPEPWLVALKEGSGMMGHLAQMAQAGAVPGMPSLPGRPVMPPTAPGQRVLPTQNPQQAPTKRKKRLPFDKSEIRGMATLKAELRRRGISMDEFLAQTTDFYRNAPDSELFDEQDGDDGQVESEENAAPSTEDPTT